MKYFFQHDEKDCGAACLATVAAYYRLYYPLQKYRELTKTTVIGTSLYGLVEGGKQIGFLTEALKGDIGELVQGLQKKEISFPFISRTIKGHYVVVLKLSQKEVQIFDPALGKRNLLVKDFFEEWSGYIVVFHKGPAFREGRYIQSTLAKIYLLIKVQWRDIMVVFMLSLALSMVGIFLSYIFNTLIEELSLTNTALNGFGVNNSDTNIAQLIANVSRKIYSDLGSVHVFFGVLLCVWCECCNGIYKREYSD